VRACRLGRCRGDRREAHRRQREQHKTFHG
jgi:hypothetical protein